MLTYEKSVAIVVDSVLYPADFRFRSSSELVSAREGFRGGLVPPLSLRVLRGLSAVVMGDHDESARDALSPRENDDFDDNDDAESHAHTTPPVDGLNLFPSVPSHTSLAGHRDGGTSDELDRVLQVFNAQAPTERQPTCYVGPWGVRPSYTGS